MRHLPGIALLLPVLLSHAPVLAAEPWTHPVSSVPIPRDRPFRGTLHLDVDASDTTQRIVRVRQRVPIQAPGMMTLLYPRWDKGSHGPTIEVQRLAGLAIHGGGRRLAWERDPLDPGAFHVQVPHGISEIALDFQYLAPLGARSPISPDFISLQWQNLVLYPAGWFARRIPVAASLTLPPGMKPGTSLVQRHSAASTTTFAPAPLDVLLDAPVMAAPHAETRTLASGPVPVEVRYFSGKAGGLEHAVALDGPLRAVLEQTAKVFGPAPFPRFAFHVALTDRLPGPGGLEHRDSADITLPADFLEQRETYLSTIDLFAHEYIHAWNGKFAEPAGHWVPTPNVPIRNSLLWVYEGQTEFWGRVIGARAGLRSFEQTLDALALDAAAMSSRPGRSWKPLADSSLDPVIMPGGVGVSWSDWQRRKDYYLEGVLLWLDVEGILRERSKGKHGMDDFASRFFGVNGKPGKRYTVDDVCKTLSALAPFDWQRYLKERVSGNSDAGLLDGLERAGYRLAFKDTPSRYVQIALQGGPAPDFSFSLGVDLDDKGVLRTVNWNSPAFGAGLAPGARIAEVDGQPFSRDLLAKVVAARNPQGIKLRIASDAGIRDVTLAYDGGMRYPTLERIPGRDDRLKRLLQAR